MKTIIKFVAIAYVLASIWIGCCLGSITCAISRKDSSLIKHMVSGVSYAITHGSAVIIMYNQIKIAFISDENDLNHGKTSIVDDRIRWIPGSYDKNGNWIDGHYE